MLLTVGTSHALVFPLVLMKTPRSFCSILLSQWVGAAAALASIATPLVYGAGNSDAPALPVAAAVAATSTETAPAPEVVNGYLKLGFDRLASYKFTPPAYDPATKPDAPIPSVEDQIPSAVKKYDGQKAMVTGFMLPVKMEGQLVTEFLLVRDPMMCCYGVTPQMNEWVVVKMVKGGVHPLMDVPISFYGQIRVKEMFENGYMTGIYLLEGEKMGEVKG
jgi:hypothetical protein